MQLLTGALLFICLLETINGQALLLNPYNPGSVAVHLQQQQPPVFARRANTDPCSPSPCGPNTNCNIDGSGNAVCRCNSGFFPKPNTITGCGPQCTLDSECQQDYVCRNTRCVDPCSRDIFQCGRNARCEVRRSRAMCLCNSGFTGNAYTGCQAEQSLTGRNPVGPPAPPPTTTNPCAPGVCGPGTNCVARSGRPVCSCLPGYQGNPISGCRRGECTSNNECPFNRACVDFNCVNPCANQCGTNANCEVNNHQAVCSCPNGYTGSPFVNCRRFDPQELCNPTPCGTNTRCNVRNDRAVCSCVENYVGNPLTGCRPECTSDFDCQSNQRCQSNKCQNACTNACGEDAYCDARNHRAVCSCPQYYLGNPQIKCYPECTTNSECGPRQACYNLRCTNPCESVCGVGADCEVRPGDRTPVCSCPRGYKGDPFTSCTPSTPADLCQPNPCGSGANCDPGFDRTGQNRPVCTCPEGYVGDPLRSCSRGECITSAECPARQACYGYFCTNPCIGSNGLSVCGTNALCNARNHKAVCFCPDEHTGDPLVQCSLKPIARGRFRRFLDVLSLFTDDE